MRGRKSAVLPAAPTKPTKPKDPLAAAAASERARAASNARWGNPHKPKNPKSVAAGMKSAAKRAQEYALQMQQQISLRATESRLQAQAVFIAHTKEAADVIVDIMRNDRYAASARLDAAKTILRAQGVIDRPDAAQNGASSIWDTDIQEVERLIAEHQNKRSARRTLTEDGEPSD